MHIRLSLLLLPLLWGIAFSASAQELLKLNLTKRCIFYPQGKEEELYSLRTETQEIANVVTDILQSCGDLEQNFTLVQANVENASAVLDGENRYLLWSLDFWENATPVMRLASIAHEIGHHVNRHYLTDEYHEIEEREADEFMGFVLCIKNIPPRSVSIEREALGLDADTSNYDRVSAISEGYAQADKSLHIASLAFENDPSWASFQKAAFPLPPPECYQTIELNRSTFYDCPKLGDVGKKIAHAFELNGYPYRFMSLPDGFAVVTQLEQYQEDGSICPDAGLRWQELPQQESFSLSLQYLKSLVFPRKAHLRVFAVLVTQLSYPSNEERISKDDAKAWIRQGVNRLPKAIAEKSFAGYSVDLLVYEFEVPETNYKPTQHCPCHLDARNHLKKAGLGQWLR